MEDTRQRIDGDEVDLPLNQEPGTAAPEIEINEIERGKEERENREPDELPSFGQGA